MKCSELESPAHERVVQRQCDNAGAAPCIEDAKTILQQGGAQKELADSLRITHQPDEQGVGCVFLSKKAHAHTTLRVARTSRRTVLRPEGLVG